MTRAILTLIIVLFYFSFASPLFGEERPAVYISATIFSKGERKNLPTKKVYIGYKEKYLDMPWETLWKCKVTECKTNVRRAILCSSDNGKTTVAAFKNIDLFDDTGPIRVTANKVFNKCLRF